MKTLSELQEEHRRWREHNFPHQTPDDAFLGMVEELGELAHARLKHRQGIRNLQHYDEVLELIKDAHADFIIFSLGFADQMGYDLGEILEETWNRVKTRDWVKYPGNGVDS